MLIAGIVALAIFLTSEGRATEKYFAKNPDAWQAPDGTIRLDRWETYTKAFGEKLKSELDLEIREMELRK